jgi:hypothetical protein
MKFNAIATDQNSFNQWVEQIQKSSNVLTSDAVEQLRVRSRDVKPLYFNNPNPLLFSDIIERFTGGLNVE